jgi:hypothetical protein
MQTQFERDVYACTGTAPPYSKDHCRVWDPDSQPSVQRELELNPNAYADRIFFTIQNGMSLTVPGVGAIPLHTDMMLCERHAKECVELYGPPEGPK